MPDRPNIIFINTDQHTWDVVSAYGYPYVKTPNIDRIVRNGISFMRSYSTDPVCGPTRASWMTGRYTSELGTPFNGGHLHEDIPDLGQILNSNGYQAFHSGKWHVDGRDVRNSFQLLYIGNRPIGAGGGEYYDGAITHAAIDFLSRYEDSDPFFLQVPYVNPHDICQCEHDHEEKTIPDPIAQGILSEKDLPPLPANFQYDERETVVHKVARRMDECLIHWPILRKVRDWSEIQWRYLMWQHHRLVEKVDSEIGLLLEALDKSQFRDNTLIMFTMDHGEAYGQHQMFQKFSLYEASVRVPFIVASLGDSLNVPKDIRDETHFVSGVDLFPSVCDYAGIDPVDGVQGLSLKPLVEGQNPAWREFAYIESNGWARSLVFDRYKYVGEYIPFGTEQDLEPIGPDPVRIGLEQIFDLVEDPDETHNLAYQPEMRDMLKRFRQSMMDFEGQLNRRRMTAQRPAAQLLNWGKQIREYWDAHPELEEMRIQF